VDLYKNQYQFTRDFNCGAGAFVNISHLVNTYGVPNSVCEIGAYEGSTTFWICDNLSPHNENLKIYVVDPHDTSADLSVDFSEVKKNFQHNLQANPYQNVTYINKPSEDGLIDLITQDLKFELVYVDGDHRAAGVLTDLVLSWKILAPGGVMLCDDTTTWRHVDKNGTAASQMSPRMAVETFIQCNWHKLKLLSLPDGSQTAFMKLEN